MEKHFEDKSSLKAHKKAVQTQRIIVIATVILAIVPLVIAWMVGSLRF